MKIVKNLKKLKNNNLKLRVLWFKTLRLRCYLSRNRKQKYVISAGYKAAFGKDIDLDHPKLFYEKLNWLKLNYRNNLMPVLSDKYAMKDYLQKLGYTDLLIDTLGIWDNPEDIDLTTLPDKFVLKATHASGGAWFFIVKDKSTITKSKWRDMKAVMREWLRIKIDWLGGEWHYGEMKPRIICEKYMEDESGELRDYKIHCFNGKPKYVTLCVGRFRGKKGFYTFDENWHLLPYTYDAVKSPDVSFKRPEHLNEMFSLAEKFAKDFQYIRVDFYSINGKIYFGEFTFFDFSAFKGPYTYESQKLIGSWINLETCK